MSRTIHNRKAPGSDWWGKRPITGISISRRGGMKYWKKLLHGKERALAKAELRKPEQL